MKTIALFVVGLAGWLAFLFPAPALANDAISVEKAEEMFRDYTALAQRCWPDLLDEQSPLYRRTVELYQAAPVTPGYEWLANDPRRTFFLTKIAADQLKIAPVPGTPVLDMKPTRVAARPAPAVAAPATQPRVIILPPRELEYERRLRLEREAAANAPSRASEQLLDSRIAEIQRKLRKLERR